MYKKIGIVLAVLLVLVAFQGQQNIFAQPTNCEEEVIPPEEGIPPDSAGDQTEGIVSEPVSLWNGEFFRIETPLTIPGRGFPFEFKMTYRSRIQLVGSLGYNWDYNLNNRIRELDNGDVKWYPGTGRVEVFERIDSTYKAPTGLFVRLTKNQDNIFTIRKKNGMKYNFNLPGADGFSKINSIVDRNGNTMSFYYDADNNLIKITDTVGRDITFTYDSEERIIQITDFAGRNVEFYYNMEGDLISITRPATAAFPSGTTKQFTYSSGFEEAVLNHNLLTITDGRENLVVENIYDGNDRVVEQLWCSNLYTFTYDTVENITVEIDPNGNVREYLFNELGNLLQLTKFTRNVRPGGDPPAYITQYAYNSEGLRTKTIFAKGNVVKTIYDEANSNRQAQSNILKIRQKASDGPDSPSDIATSFAYEPTYNLVSAITNPLGSITQYSYDSQGNLIKVIDASTNESVYTYDAHGQLLSLTDAGNNTTNYTYDSFGNMTKIIDSLTNQTEFSYDTIGNLTALTDAKGNITGYIYDNLNQLLTIAYLDQTKAVYVYDANGNRASVKDQKGNTTKYIYDILNRLIKAKDAIEGITRYVYDPNGNRLSVIDAKNNKTSYTYDELDRLYTTTTPMGHVSTYSYDLNSNRTVLTDAKGNTINYTYDHYNRLSQILYPNSSAVSFSYDKAGRRTSMTDTTGTTTYKYDNLNRLTSVIVGGSEAISYTYNEVGNRVSMTDQNAGTNTYEYDALNRLVKLTDPSGKETNYSYDEVSNLTNMSYPNTTQASYTFDNLNRLVELVNKSQRSVSASHRRLPKEKKISSYVYDYDSAGMRTKVILKDKNYIEYTYDGLNRLTKEIKYNRRGHLRYSYEYTFDAVGNRLSMRQTPLKHIFWCDCEGYLGKKLRYEIRKELGIKLKGKQEKECYSSYKCKPVILTNYTYNKENQLIHEEKGLEWKNRFILFCNTEYAYDNNGNQVEKKTVKSCGRWERERTTTYEYDYANRLVKITYPEIGRGKYEGRGKAKGWNPRIESTEYVYDGVGKRIKATESNNITRYLYDGLNCIIERNEGNQTTASYVRGLSYGGGIGGIISATRTKPGHRYSSHHPATQYYHYDGIGSVTGLTNTKGRKVASYTYDAYGNILRQTGLAKANPYRFSTKEFSPQSGLIYFGARYYDPMVGRWTQPDPLRIVNEPNLYVYCLNNPLNLIDPLGLTVNWGRVWEGVKGIGWGVVQVGGGLTATQLDSPLPGPADVVGATLIWKGIMDCAASVGTITEGLAGVPNSQAMLDPSLIGTMTNIFSEAFIRDPAYKKLAKEAGRIINDMGPSAAGKFKLPRRVKNAYDMLKLVERLEKNVAKGSATWDDLQKLKGEIKGK